MQVIDKSKLGRWSNNHLTEDSARYIKSVCDQEYEATKRPDIDRETYAQFAAQYLDDLDKLRIFCELAGLQLSAL